MRKQVIEQGLPEGSEHEFRAIVSGRVVHILVGRGDTQTPKKDQIAAVARGAADGLTAIGVSSFRSSQEILLALQEASDQLGLDPEFLVRWALAGLAAAFEQSPDSVRAPVRELLERTYAGLGEAFARLCAPLRPASEAAPAASSAAA